VSAATTGWQEANQGYLSATLAVVRRALERHSGSSENRHDEDLEGELRGVADAMSGPPSLETLCAAFRLSTFERGVLLLCAGVELDAGVASACAASQGDPRRVSPTFALALAALPGAHWSALTPAAPLRGMRLIEVGAGETLTGSPLRIDERVLHFLAGLEYTDERLRGIVEPLPAADELVPSHRTLARRISSLWSRAEEAPVIQLCGADLAGKHAVAAAACASLDLSAHAVRARDVPAAAAERETLARLLEREAVLSGRVPLLEFEDASEIGLALVESIRGPIFISCREPLAIPRRRSVRMEVRRPTTAEQRDLWLAELGPQPMNGQVEVLVSQFDLGAKGIRIASAEAAERTGEALWDACRAQARGQMDNLAQRVPPSAAWEDLVLPEPQKEVLREVVANVRQRARVYDAWGFVAKGSRGLGISALFAGESGTGKTMAAEVLARELRLDLYRIDLSSVVSKYIGETEKNLRRVFDAAEEGGAILLFDEADALFGKRSEVKDSHDRYANIEVSYLLQRMESYRGLAILTTNMKSELDPAFLRRLRFVVQFPFPDAGGRAEIWRRIFPKDTPTEGLDADALARLNVAGGNIRNIALGAAFLAADAGEPVRMDHLLRAARTEYAKLEKRLTDAESGGWA
jgi:ATP-dependent 26S proteasome regulatory subunit